MAEDVIEVQQPLSGEIVTNAGPKSPSNNKFVGAVYAKKAGIAEWTSMKELAHPQRAEEYVNLLLGEGLLPSVDKASGFTFYSSSANQGLYEHAIAQKLDNLFLEEPAVPPLFIAADMFGSGDKENFVPGFNTKIFTGENFNYVNFQKLSAEAERIPLKDGSVDIVWDRLGALWHEQMSRLKRDLLSDKAIRELLNEYKRVLKPNGCVIVDAADVTKGANKSTFDFLNGETNDSQSGLNYKVDFASLGWNVQLIGSGDSRLAVLRPSK